MIYYMIFLIFKVQLVIVVHRGTRRPGIVAWLYFYQYDQQGQQDTVKLQTKYEQN